MGAGEERKTGHKQKKALRKAVERPDDYAAVAELSVSAGAEQLEGYMAAIAEASDFALLCVRNFYGSKGCPFGFSFRR